MTGILIRILFVWCFLLLPRAAAAASADPYGAWQACAEGPCAYEFHLHSGNPRWWQRADEDPTTDPDSAQFVKCAHSCRSPYEVYQDCLDNGLDGCGISNHSSDLDLPDGLAWMRATSTDWADSCGGVVDRDPGHGGDWDYLVGEAERFEADNPGFVALTEIEWTVSEGHKTSACTKPARPYCRQTGAGSPEGDAHICSGEEGLYAMARGEVSQYPPGEEQRCSFVLAHPCGQGAAATDFRLVDSDVVTGYEIRPQLDGRHCIEPGQFVDPPTADLALPYFSALSAGFWLHTASGLDAHHFGVWPEMCGLSTAFRAGKARRTYCWVDANTPDGLHAARLARRCYFSQGRLRLRAWAREEGDASGPAIAVLGSEISHNGGIRVKLQVERLPDPEPYIDLEALELWHDGVNVAQGECDGLTCSLEADFPNGLGWWAVVVKDLTPPSGMAEIATVAGLWTIAGVPRLSLLPYTTIRTDGE